MGPRIVAFASHVRNDGKICSTQGSLLHGTFLCLCLHTRKIHGKLSFRTGKTEASSEEGKIELKKKVVGGNGTKKKQRFVVEDAANSGRDMLSSLVWCWKKEKPKESCWRTSCCRGKPRRTERSGNEPHGCEEKRRSKCRKARSRITRQMKTDVLRKEERGLLHFDSLGTSACQ